MSVRGAPRYHLGDRLCHSHTFEISANVGYFGVTGRALLMSLQGRNALRNGLVKLVMAVCLLKFAYYFIIFYVLCYYLLSLALILHKTLESVLISHLTNVEEHLKRWNRIG